MVENVIIMGAAGRDFHNFNVYFRNNQRYNVIAFTAAQIPNIENRRYPPNLAGSHYPQGIPIHPETDLVGLIKQHKVDMVSFSYSDIHHTQVMHKCSMVNAAGADFVMIAAPYTMLKSNKKVVSVCAVRTGCGKSQVSREIYRILTKMGKKSILVRHPMPYGDLQREAVQRYADVADFDIHHCTIEEREEYEPVIEMGAVIYAGIDYEKILREAEKEAEIIIWDGGNNDTPFFHPDLSIVLFDPHRAGHERSYHPGETNMLMADIAVINKVDTANPEKIQEIRNTIETHNPKAVILQADSVITAEDPDCIKGKRVLVVEDGPTLTHGGMRFGAGTLAAKRFGAAKIVDPRPWLSGTFKDLFNTYPDIGLLLPAAGYSTQQISDMEQTINNVDCDLVILGTTSDLTRFISIDKPTVRIRYEYKDHGLPSLETEIARHMDLW
ncbi:cyclic 2,3-diphosphoglycerate synthase [Desulfobacula sp.]|uniref:cyclic 2,3-diphosphoglycerate synthase n=1 Tax=Desulfobacula sp. TaxID=2593537 RepID=UPI00263120EA|nr:cyclic 2,3-diphosphoglycerate synthase [Desulfobacula sp.]